jgi:hypothetical protein
MFAKQDAAENVLYLRVFYDENKERLGCNVYLKLKAEQRSRLIGDCMFIERTMYVKRDSSKHLMLKINAYGFNWEVINDPMLHIQNINMTIDDTQYLVPKKVLMEEGMFLNFKQAGFELQKFLPMSVIAKYIIKQPWHGSQTNP